MRFAGLFVMLLVLALPSVTPIATLSVSGLSLGPRVAVNTASSTNWSGYAVTGTGVSDAKGSWVIPSVSCSKHGSSYAAFWVGIDGFSSSTVEQTGVLAQCSSGKASYSAWYEFYPAASVTISGFSVSPGQVVSAEVQYISGSTFSVTITDTSTGKSFTTTGSVSGAQRSSAEWIVERPELCSVFRCSLTNLANFGTAQFGLDYTGLSGTNTATVNGVSGAISSFPNTAINMVNSNGATIDQTSVLTSDGTSFSVTYG